MAPGPKQTFLKSFKIEKPLLPYCHRKIERTHTNSAFRESFVRVGTLVIRRPKTALAWLGVFFLILCSAFCWIQHLQAEIMEAKIYGAIGRERNTRAAVQLEKSTTIFEPSHGCQSDGYNALGIIMVPTLPQNRLRRELIRQTWARNKFSESFMVFFFIGQPSDSQYEDLAKEANLHGDLIVDDLKEDYYALGIKTLRMLKWFHQKCSRAQFFLKVDDDVFLDIPYYKEILEGLPQDFKLGGRVLLGGSPNLHNSFTKYYTPPSMWKESMRYSKYIGGPTYVIKGEIVPQILEVSLDIPLYHLEDVFVTGMIAGAKLGYELTQIPGTFDPKYPNLWVICWQLFGGERISSFHSDGEVNLIDRLYSYFN